MENRHGYFAACVSIPNRGNLESCQDAHYLVAKTRRDRTIRALYTAGKLKVEGFTPPVVPVELEKLRKDFSVLGVIATLSRWVVSLARLPTLRRGSGAVPSPDRSLVRPPTLHEGSSKFAGDFARFGIARPPICCLVPFARSVTRSAADPSRHNH